MKLVKIQKLTNEKFLNLYNLIYQTDDGKLVTWTMSSRYDIEHLTCKSGDVKADCVCIIPKIIVNGEPCLIITKEFRLPVNNYVYGFPAGLIDGNETPELSAVRELGEEIGATKVGKVTRLTEACLNSEGLTDESTVTLEAEILELGNQNLQDEEDISYEIVKIKDLNKFLEGKILGAKLGVYAPVIVRNYELEKAIKYLKAENDKLKEKLAQNSKTKRPDEYNY